MLRRHSFSQKELWEKQQICLKPERITYIMNLFFYGIYLNRNYAAPNKVYTHEYE